MAVLAREGAYDDFRSSSPSPTADLLQSLEQRLAAHQSFRGTGNPEIEALISEVKRGGFAGTKADAEEWRGKVTDPALRRLMDQLAGKNPPQ